MIRRPLRPLARIISQRQRGEDPDDGAQQSRRIDAMRREKTRERKRARTRLILMGLAFTTAFGAVGTKMGMMAAPLPEEEARRAGVEIKSRRADIVDRNGTVLATNIATSALYAHPQQLIDKVGTAARLAEIFPDVDAAKLLEQFNSKRKFLWLKRRISPEQQQAVHEIGDPGLLFGPRQTRIYPNGRLASHIVGGAGYGAEGVAAAEIIGTAGVEHWFDQELRADNAEPLELSIDLSVQSAIRRVLAGGMRLMNAKGASAVLMDVETGEVISMVSLPDFDPNARPAPPTSGDQSASPLFNRAAQGIYELGSTFKIFTAGLAIESGIAAPSTQIDTRGPMKWGKHKIRDFRNYGPTLSLTDVVVKSSNIGSANLAIEFGAERQKAMMKQFGFLEPTSVELGSAKLAKPLTPKNWSEIYAITISYGHGLSASPLHLASAYATIGNGGKKVTPTLVKGAAPAGEDDRIIAESTAKELHSMLRAVVERGTASLGKVEGYDVGGKTGTAEKPRPSGGYYKERVIANFAALFPSADPKYALVVTLDEPVERSGAKPRRTAGWTAVPVAAEVIRRIAPMMGMRPEASQMQATAAKAKLIKISNQ